MSANEKECRVFKSGNYTLMGNYHLHSTAIDLRATGLLCRVINLPDVWDYSVAGLTAICKEGETAIRTAINELKKWGYLAVRKLFPNETANKKIGYSYQFSEYSELDPTVKLKPPTEFIIAQKCGSNGSKVIRVKKNANYTVMSCGFLRSKNLSLRAVGLLSKVLSLPPEWNFSVRCLSAICKDSIGVIRKTIKELIKWGYLKRVRLNSNEGKHHWFEYVYEFYDVSDIDVPEVTMTKNSKKFSTGAAAEKPASSQKIARQEGVSQPEEKQGIEKQYIETPHTENPAQINTKKKINKNQVYSDESSIDQSAAANEVFNKTGVTNSDERMNDEAHKAEIEYYTEIVRENIDYWELGDWLTTDGRDGYAEADDIVGFIVDEICSPMPYTILRKQKFYRETMRSKMLKANIDMIQSTLEKMSRVDDIHDFRKYFISTLYNEVISYNFNEGCESRWASYAVAQHFGCSA